MTLPPWCNTSHLAILVIYYSIICIYYLTIQLIIESTIEKCIEEAIYYYKSTFKALLSMITQ